MPLAHQIRKVQKAMQGWGRLQNHDERREFAAVFGFGKAMAVKISRILLMAIRAKLNSSLSNVDRSKTCEKLMVRKSVQADDLLFLKPMTACEAAAVYLGINSMFANDTKTYAIENKSTRYLKKLRDLNLFINDVTSVMKDLAKL